jgi:hypothetical protein
MARSLMVWTGAWLSMVWWAVMEVIRGWKAWLGAGWKRKKVPKDLLYARPIYQRDFKVTPRTAAP